MDRMLNEYLNNYTRLDERAAKILTRIIRSGSGEPSVSYVDLSMFSITNASASRIPNNNTATYTITGSSSTVKAWYHVYYEIGVGSATSPTKIALAHGGVGVTLSGTAGSPQTISGPNLPTVSPYSSANKYRLGLVLGVVDPPTPTNPQSILWYGDETDTTKQITVTSAYSMHPSIKFYNNSLNLSVPATNTQASRQILGYSQISEPNFIINMNLSLSGVSSPGAGPLTTEILFGNSAILANVTRGVKIFFQNQNDSSAGFANYMTISIVQYSDGTSLGIANDSVASPSPVGLKYMTGAQIEFLGTTLVLRANSNARSVTVQLNQSKMFTSGPVYMHISSFDSTLLSIHNFSIINSINYT